MAGKVLAMVAAAGTAAAHGFETKWVTGPFECHGHLEPPDHYDPSFDSARPVSCFIHWTLYAVECICLDMPWPVLFHLAAHLEAMENWIKK
jgi:hypothetical protein